VSLIGAEQRDDPPLGAYGIRLHGVEEASHLLVAVSADAPGYELVAERGPAAAPEEHVDDGHAELRLPRGGQIVIDREAGRVRFRVPESLRADEIVHPYLAPAAAVIARWAGRESIHAGAFAGRHGVWGLVARREGGKSSTLAWLARAGADVLCDDMLVLDGRTPLAGPRTVDLREDAATRLGEGEDIGLTGARERWRVALGPAAAPAPLAGWVFLTWGEPFELRRLGGAERLNRLAGERALRLPPVRPEAFLELLELPAWELRRPLGWGSMPETADRLRDLADG
jgi:hypothetical protein